MTDRRTLLRHPLLRDTIWLYLRMAALLLINLTLTRVLLEGFGVDDFGVYSLVMSTVMLWTFLTDISGETALRYISVAIGSGRTPESVASTFTTFLRIHALAIAVMTIAALISGYLWLTGGARLAPDQQPDAMALLGILAAMLALKSAGVPFQSWLVAHERFRTYATLSVCEGCATLAVALAIAAFPSASRPVVYGGILAGVEAVTLVAYLLTVIPSLRVIAGAWSWRPDLMREALRYIVWVTLGGIAVMAWSEGMTLLTNNRFGVEATAACAIAMGLLGRIRGFCAGIQRAAVPRIIKDYAAGQITAMKRLTLRYSMASFAVMAVAAVPLIIYAPWWLGLWLGDVPEGLVPLIRIVLAAGLIEVFHTPLNAVIHATGRIRAYQIIDSAILLLIIPVAWSVAACGMSLTATFASQLLLLAAALAVRVIMARHLLRNSSVKP